MLMSKNVNNDVSKDSPIIHCLPSSCFFLFEAGTFLSRGLNSMALQFSHGVRLERIHGEVYTVTCVSRNFYFIKAFFLTN